MPGNTRSSVQLPTRGSSVLLFVKSREGRVSLESRRSHFIDGRTSSQRNSDSLVDPKSQRPGDVPGECGWRNWLDKAYTWMQGHTPTWGETPFCSRPESRSQPLLLSDGLAGERTWKSSLHPGLCVPTPSSKTEEARWRSQPRQDCNLAGRGSAMQIPRTH